MLPRSINFMFVLLLFCVMTMVDSQDSSSCSTIIEAALVVTQESCNGLERNQACYGNNRVDVTFWEDQEETIFSEPSDRIPLLDLQSIATSPLNIDPEAWGVAVLNLQTNLPDGLPGQAVTFMLMGDSSIENEVSSEATDEYAPMQAFYFQSGIGELQCNEAPNALIIQNSSGEAIELRVNDLNVTIGSTLIIFMGEVDGEMAIALSLIEGHVAITSGAITTVLTNAGDTIGITLNGDNRVDDNSKVVSLDDETYSLIIQSACKNATILDDISSEDCDIVIQTKNSQEPTDSEAIGLTAEWWCSVDEPESTECGMFSAHITFDPETNTITEHLSDRTFDYAGGNRYERVYEVEGFEGPNNDPVMETYIDVIEVISPELIVFHQISPWGQSMLGYYKPR